MKKRKSLSRGSFLERITDRIDRRSFIARVTGGALLAGGAIPALVSDTFAMQTGGCNDTDRGAGADPPDRGRSCPPPPTIRNYGHGTPGNCVDYPTIGAGSDRDPAGGGRRCVGGTSPTSPSPPGSGCSDSDQGAGADPLGRGRNCAGGCSDSDQGVGADPLGGGRNCGQQRSHIQAWFDPECNPLRDLYQSRLPSTVCHLNIRGFRRNTEDPVEVVLPQAIDGFGNHRNGIQVNLAGQARTYDWPEVYRWTLFIFGCPAQPGTGANCYNAGTRLGPGQTLTFSVPIIVRQRGAGEARVMLNGTMLPHPTVTDGMPANNPLSFPPGWYIFQNLWRREFFLNYNNETRWLVQPVLEQPGYVRIHSAANQTYVIHVENGTLFVGPYQPYWDSALWALESPRGPGLVRIRNKWRGDWYIHTERGFVEAGPAPPQWDSSVWIMQPVGRP